jgi:hypothetical protein
MARHIHDTRPKLTSRLLRKTRDLSSQQQNGTTAISRLNRKFAIEDPEEEGDRDESVAEYELLAEMAPKIVVKGFENGPFVINHNDLTLQNILVRKYPSLRLFLFSDSR